MWVRSQDKQCVSDDAIAAAGRGEQVLPKVLQAQAAADAPLQSLQALRAQVWKQELLILRDPKCAP